MYLSEYSIWCQFIQQSLWSIQFAFTSHLMKFVKEEMINFMEDVVSHAVKPNKVILSYKIFVYTLKCLRVGILPCSPFHTYRP